MFTTQNTHLQTTIETYSSFDAMELNYELLKSIYSLGFEFPSSVQQRAIVPFIQGRDMIVQSFPGTGKTTAFIIGTLQQIEVEKNVCQAIILVPIEELSLIIEEMIYDLSEYLDIDAFACISGISITETIEIVKQGVHIIVGTPGEVYDMIERGVIDPNSIKVTVFDEVDEMFSEGFEDEMYTILEELPTSVQVGIFSSTISQEILEILKEFMNDPIEIVVKKEQALEGIKQFYIDVEEDEYKIDIFGDLYQVISVNQSIVFCNSQERVEWIKTILKRYNFPISIIHDDMSMEDRIESLTEFMEGSTRVLITTDLLSRNDIDVEEESLVINFDMPVNDDNYIHRVSKCIGFGRKGVVINFITSDEMERINTMNQTYGTKIVPL